ncbi:MAG: glycoside hydrolase family 2 TIM barrel-domain containing protein, partial [bacterium]
MPFNPIEDIPNPFRKIAWLDGKWEFKLAGSETRRVVAVPHTWNTIPGLENYEGQAEYRIKFRLPRAWKKGEIKLHIGACGGLCEVALNGKQVAVSRPSERFTPIEADVTGAIFMKKDNLLIVKIDNSPRSAGMQFAGGEKNYGGITREVYVERSGNIRFEEAAIDSRPEENGTASVRIRAVLAMPPGEATHVFGRISREKGPAVTDFDFDVTADAQGQGVIDWRGGIPNAELWSPETPARYELTLVTVSKDGDSDGIEKKFGIRRIEFRNGGFFYNGEQVTVRAVEWREQFPGNWGPIVTRAMIERDFEKIRLAGFNAVRFSHPVHPAVLEYCDANGVLVFEDFPLWKGIGDDPAGEAAKSATDSLWRMIDRDQSHPSVIGWGMGRALRADDVITNDWIMYNAQTLRRRDPGRLIYADFNAPGPESKPVSVDFILLSEYPGWTGETVSGFMRGLEAKYSDLRDKPYELLKYGAGGIPGRAGGVNIKGTESNQLFNLSRVESYMRDNPAAPGWFVDSFADYEGPEMDPRGSVNTVYTGLLTAERMPKPAFQWFAGLEDDGMTYKLSHMPFRMPSADLAAFLLLLIAGLAIWSGFSKMWPAFIEPDLLGPSEGDWRWIARNFILFGLPMLLIAGAAASFAAAGLMDLHPFDPGRLPIATIQAANEWLRPFAMRFAALTILQLVMLIVAALIMALFLDG